MPINSSAFFSVCIAQTNSRGRESVWQRCSASSKGTAVEYGRRERWARAPPSSSPAHENAARSCTRLNGRERRASGGRCLTIVVTEGVRSAILTEKRYLHFRQRRDIQTLARAHPLSERGSAFLLTQLFVGAVGGFLCGSAKPSHWAVYRLVAPSGGQMNAAGIDAREAVDQKTSRPALAG